MPKEISTGRLCDSFEDVVKNVKRGQRYRVLYHDQPAFDIVPMSKENLWDVRRALVQMHGMEQACRLLIADLDREITDRDSYKVKNPPRAIGIAAVTTVQCALFCEYAIKTFHSLLSDGKCRKGHALDDLYDLLEKQYVEVASKAPGDLSEQITSQMRSPEARCSSEWSDNIDDVRSTLSIGSANFEDWRYGYPERRELSGGVPKGLFAIAKGIELLCRRRFQEEPRPVVRDSGAE